MLGGRNVVIHSGQCCDLGLWYRGRNGAAGAQAVEGRSVRWDGNPKFTRHQPEHARGGDLARGPAFRS